MMLTLGFEIHSLYRTPSRNSRDSSLNSSAETEAQLKHGRKHCAAQPSREDRSAGPMFKAGRRWSVGQEDRDTTLHPLNIPATISHDVAFSTVYKAKWRHKVLKHIPVNMFLYPKLKHFTR